MTPEQLEALWRQGQQQEAQHQLDAARETYAQILAGSPRQVMVRLRASELEQRAGRYRDARAHALQAADIVAGSARWEALAKVVEAYWPETITPADLTNPDLWAQAREAHAALEAAIG